jgi:hypothetical protein
MERLLVLKLDAQGCEAEAWLNGIAIARVDAARPNAIVPIHEYTLAGLNRLELVVWPRPVAAADKPIPPPLALVSDGHLGATQDVSLPVSFPRWRWMDAQPAEATPALHRQAMALLQQFAQELAAGETDGFLGATRLRTEELAVAYQRRPEDAAAGLRSHMAELYAAKALSWLPLQADGFILRRLAGGRLLECLDAAGEPALRTAPDAQGHAHLFPVRLAVVEGKLYVLR